MASKGSIVGSFIEQAPPGELNDVVNDIKSLTAGDPSLLQSQTASFKKYNEEQLTTVKLPGSSQETLISSYNSLSDGRYYDSENSTSFDFDQVNRKASNAQSHVLESKHADLVKSLQKSLRNQATEHFPAFALGVFPTADDSSIALVLVSNKYSPSNFWNGRWRSQYTFDTSSGAINGTIKVDVHYYEDGNVRMLTDRKISVSASSGASAQEIVRQIGLAEKKYQEELNRGFTALNEGAFKGLRRQLPVTRQKIEWDRIGGYRLGQDIGGGRSR